MRVYRKEKRGPILIEPQSHAWLLLTTFVVFTFLSPLPGVAEKQAPKPKLRVSTDGLPGGHDTPEGAACDLARSFIRHYETGTCAGSH